MNHLYRRHPQAPTKFELERTLADVTTLIARVAHKRQVRLETESTGRSKRVVMPEGEVKQILYNLIPNAVQASPVGETVTIRIARSSGAIRVTVIDHGTGIADDVLPHIFDPFFTTKGSEPNGGMGLGLSVSRRLIEAMGGSIEVNTVAGKGSAFTAVFPRQGEPSIGEVHD